MVHYLVATHGKLAQGFESALKVLLGSTDNIHFIDCYVDETNPKEKIEAVVNSVGNDQLIMFSDLAGGSVNQIMNEYCLKENIYQITGINLAVLIEIIATNKECYTKEELHEIVKNAQTNLMLFDYQSDDLEQEEDFF